MGAALSDLGGDGRAALDGLRAAWGRDWDAAGEHLAVLLAAMGWEGWQVPENGTCPDTGVADAPRG